MATPVVTRDRQQQRLSHFRVQGGTKVIAKCDRRQFPRDEDRMSYWLSIVVVGSEDFVGSRESSSRRQAPTTMELSATLKSGQ